MTDLVEKLVRGSAVLNQKRQEIELIISLLESAIPWYDLQQWVKAQGKAYFDFPTDEAGWRWTFSIKEAFDPKRNISFQFEGPPTHPSEVQFAIYYMPGHLGFRNVTLVHRKLGALVEQFFEVFPKYKTHLDPFLKATDP